MSATATVSFSALVTPGCSKLGAVLRRAVLLLVLLSAQSALYSHAVGHSLDAAVGGGSHLHACQLCLTAPLLGCGMARTPPMFMPLPWLVPPVVAVIGVWRPVREFAFLARAPPVA